MKNLMKLMLALVLAGGMVTFSGCGDKKADGKGDGKDTTKEAGKTGDNTTPADQNAAPAADVKVFHYICSMNDGGQADEAGKCSVCKMDLVENPAWLAQNAPKADPATDKPQ